jgi:hypothetical protein
LKLVKRLRRAANSTPLQVLRFGGARLINNWVQPNSHASSSLRKTTALLKDIIDMDLSGRRFNGTVSHEDSVQMFVIEVIMYILYDIYTSLKSHFIAVGDIFGQKMGSIL